MKTPDEWANEVYRLFNERMDKSLPDRTPGFRDCIWKVVRDAMEEAAENAISNVPPLPELKINDDDIDLMESIAKEDPELMKIANYFIADRKTLMRMLADCDSLDAYLRGFAAGREAGATAREEELLKEGIPVVLDTNTNQWMIGGKVPRTRATLKIVMDAGPGGSFEHGGMTVNQMRQASGLPPIAKMGTLLHLDGWDQ